MIGLVILLALKESSGTPLNKENRGKLKLKDGIERKFNETVVTAVETKMFLLDAVGRAVNKTADKLLTAKQHVKNVRESIQGKSLKKLENMKEKLRENKDIAKHTDRHLIHVARDFLIAPPPIRLIPSAGTTVPTSFGKELKVSPFAPKLAV